MRKKSCHVFLNFLFNFAHIVLFIRTANEKKNFSRGPMRPVLNANTRVDDDRNEKVTNINYDRKLVVLFFKTIINQFKKALGNFYTKKN